MKLSCLHSRFVLFALACVVAFQMSPRLSAGGPDVGNKESRTLTVTKECSTATLHPGELDYCVIESEQGGGGTAFGHCLVRGVPEVLGASSSPGGAVR